MRVITVPTYRRCNFISYIAQQKRSPMLKALNYYMEMTSKKPGYCYRMWVIHDGPRCQSLFLRDRWSEQKRKIRTFNKSKFARKMGIQIIFRSSEAGSPLAKTKEKVWNAEKRIHERRYLKDENGERILIKDKQGRQTYHPHTHCLVEFSRWYTDQEWDAIGKYARNHFGMPQAHLDQGEVKDVREVCKYLVKSDDLMACSDIDFLRFYKRVKGLHQVQFLGELKKFRQWLEENCLVPRWQANPDDEDGSYVLKKNHNRSVIRAQESEGEKLQKALAKTRPRQDGFAIIARNNPQPLASPVSEPAFMIRGKFEAGRFYKHPEVKSVIAHTEDHYETGCALFEALYKVSVEQWLHDPIIAAQMAANAACGRPELVLDGVASLGSAHTTPVSGTRNPEFEQTGSSLVGKRRPEPPPETQTQVNLRLSRTTETKNPSLSQTGSSLVGAFNTNHNET